MIDIVFNSFFLIIASSMVTLEILVNWFFFGSHQTSGIYSAFREAVAIIIATGMWFIPMEEGMAGILILALSTLTLLIILSVRYETNAKMGEALIVAVIISFIVSLINTLLAIIFAVIILLLYPRIGGASRLIRQNGLFSFMSKPRVILVIAALNIFALFLMINGYLV